MTHNLRPDLLLTSRLPTVCVGGEVILYVRPDGLADIDSPLLIRLDFQEWPTLYIECGQDGESISISNCGSLEAFQMGSLGETQKLPISSVSSLAPLVGALVTSVAEISDELDRAVGIEICLKDRKSLLLINLGDELRVLEFLPAGFTINRSHVIDNS